MQFNLKRASIIVVALLVVIQFFPVKRTNPPGENKMTAPAEVQTVLKESCFDCHSNETVWPWYSRVAPVSWLVAHGVNTGRGKLNFSTWDQLEARKKDKLMVEIWDEVEGGEMPLSYYLPVHPQAKLSEADLAVLRTWTGAGAAAGQH